VDDGLVLPATPEQEQRIAELRAAKLGELEAHRHYLEAETRVVDAIGAAAGLSSPHGTVTFRQTADATHVDWAALARELFHREFPTLEGDDLTAAVDSEARSYTTTREGSRRIWLPRSWSKPGSVPG
jgi:hypothetical protein